jgi:DNA polymerase I-like protein with 3'-5' exonuclease and polymerase domains
MHNATYDAGWLRAEGIEVQGRIIDTMITGALVDENRFSYALNSLGRDYLGETKSERLLRAAAKEFGVDPKAEMYKLPAKYVGAYAEQDAALTLRLWHRLRAEVENQDLWHIWRLETGLIPMMMDMRSQGVRVDVDKAEQTKSLLQKKTKEFRAFIKKESGIDIEPWASASVAQVFDAIGEGYESTEKGAPSFTKQWLQNHPHKVAQAIVKLREFDKADSTFIDTILRHQTNGRIHCELHQLRSDDGGTVTGRFSSSNPNLQQIPAKDKEIKSMIRGLFIPEDGCKWGSFDYASQEPRLLVHFAASMPDTMRHPVVDKIVEEYNTSDVDLHQIVADIIGLEGAKGRKAAKVVNLGIMYGMGKGKLATQLSITPEEASDLLNEHASKVPFVRELADMASKRAESVGTIRTLLGRKCRFELYEPKTFGYKKPLPLEEARKEYGPMVRRAFTYKALNKLIQGSAADQTKKAMEDCYAEGLLPMLTVHDELCFSVEGDDQARRIKDIMENGLSNVLKVPSKVDDALKDNWGEVE